MDWPEIPSVNVNDGLQPCFGCERRSPQHEVTNYWESPNLRTKLQEFFHIEMIRDGSLPETLCCICVARINVCVQFQRMFIKNMMINRISYYNKTGDDPNLLNNQEQWRALRDRYMKYPTHVSKAFFKETSVTQMMRVPLARRNIMNTDTAGLIISDVRTEERPQEPDSTGGQIEHVHATAVPTAGSELLEPMFQTSENAKDTESGGNIDAQNRATSRKRHNSDRGTFPCQYCDKIYQRAYAWRKHMRSHQAIEQRRTMANNKAVGAAKKRTFKCPECDQVFKTKYVLRKHGAKHEKWYTCNVCSKKFRSSHEITWHKVECDAKNSVMGKRKRRRTRSHERTIRSRSNCSTESTQTDSMYNVRIKGVKEWVYQMSSKRPNPKGLVNNIRGTGKGVLIDTDASGLARNDIISATKLVANNEPAPPAKKYSARELRELAKKRRKIHMEARQRAKKNGREYYICSFGLLCTFGNPSLLMTMLHEVHEHNALLLYSCGQCKEHFTTDDFLKRHTKRHRPQFHLCVSCKGQFNNRYELEIHTRLHAEKSHACVYCEMSFLKTDELENHILKDHKYDKFKKHGILERLTSSRTGDANRNKIQEFQGYKTKELIQRSIQKPNQQSEQQVSRTPAVPKRYKAKELIQQPIQKPMQESQPPQVPRIPAVPEVPHPQVPQTPQVPQAAVIQPPQTAQVSQAAEEVQPPIPLPSPPSSPEPPLPIITERRFNSIDSALALDVDTSSYKEHRQSPIEFASDDDYEGEPEPLDRERNQDNLFIMPTGDQPADVTNIEEEPQKLHETPQQGTELQETPQQLEELQETPHQPAELQETPHQPEELEETPPPPQELQKTPQQPEELEETPPPPQEVQKTPQQPDEPLESSNILPTMGTLNDMQTPCAKTMNAPSRRKKPSGKAIPQKRSVRPAGRKRLVTVFLTRDPKLLAQPLVLMEKLIPPYDILLDPINTEEIIQLD